ncbi:MAG: response regulator [Patescibacteria group bacterium]|jgi:DNA-binding response OmpR family regulator
MPGNEQQAKVLLVEDDVGISEMYATALRMAGYTVQTALDGAAGLVAAITEPPDVVLLDIILPELDGFDVLQRLKGNSKTAQIPVLLLSNLSQPEQVERGKVLGAVDYFVKANHIPADIVRRLGELLPGRL